jgi:putative methionine-R-sulfoxide reductase with GAF domain
VASSPSLHLLPDFCDKFVLIALATTRTWLLRYRCGIDSMSDTKQSESIVKSAWKLQASDVTTAELKKLWTYLEPDLTSGACSRVNCSRVNKLKSEPFDLAKVYGLAIDEALANHALTLRQRRFQKVLHDLHASNGAEWLGIYLAMPDAGTEDGKKVACLVKHAYIGAESRALFPLTQTFAAHSNNSTVGLTKKACLIQDVRTHHGPYYECNSKVLVSGHSLCRDWPTHVFLCCRQSTVCRF